MKPNGIVTFGGSGNCGLGNRLTAICGGYAAAKTRGVNYAAVWTPGTGCNAKWSDIFKPPTLFNFVSKVPAGALRHHEPSYIPRRRPAHFRAIGQQEFPPAYWEAWQECARSFELIDELALPDANDFIAVSIRGNFRPRAAAPGWWTRVKLPSGSFICSDSKDQFEKALEVCEDAWFLSQPTTNRDLANRGIRGVQAAARDMMMMCRAKVILAVGNRSTLRNVPVIGYGVPIFKLCENRNP
jgi:hypothetical protein